MPAAWALAHPLQLLTERLAAAQTHTDVLQAVLAPAVAALGALCGVVLLLDTSQKQLSVADEVGDRAGSVWRAGALRPATPVADALAREQNLYFEDAGELLAAYPDLETETGGQVTVASAVVPLIGSRPLGALILDFKEPHTFTAGERQFLEVLATQTVLALQRAELLGRLHDTARGVEALRAEGSRLERQVAQGTADLQAEQIASQVFVRFSEAASRTDDIDKLGRLAMDTLQAVIPGSSGVIYTLGGADTITGAEIGPGRVSWSARQWTDDLADFTTAEVQRGLPEDVHAFAQAMQTLAPAFIGDEDETREAGDYRTTAVYPVLQDGSVRTLLTLNLPTEPRWTTAQQATIGAVGRSFTLLYARISAAAELRLQREEAASRARALEAFAVLSRDLAGETDRYALIRRAQEIMLSLLTPGYALYWEQAEDRHWALKSQVGDIGDPALQRLVDEHGLPFEAPALHSTWLSGAPHYQDHYAQGADTPAEMIRHVQAATAFRVEVQGQPIGMLAIGLFDQRTWTPMDRAALATAIYSLGLVLERARSIEALAERTAELEQTNQELAASNAELEAFTYSASHDLRTPVRHVRAFAELAEKSRQPEQTDKYLQVIKDAATRMNSMIDAMLMLSRAGRVEFQVQPVSLHALIQRAQQDARLEFPQQAVEWQIESLPTVQGDPDTLQQAVTNLIGNAVKYGKGREPLHVKIWAENRTTEWAVLVQDTGVGFDPTYAHKLFGAFQRLHNQRDFEGTGIGLATVKRIVTRHGGRVWAEGRPGEGATFGFSLPKTR